jgi:NADP-dependent 3-hydroxy acid dehydrogenase YdfG
MVLMDSPVMEITSWEFRQIVEATFLGAVNGTHCAMKRMIPRDRGMVIQVGSPLVFRSIPLQSAYRASKHAIRGFTESLQSELIHLKSNVGLSIVNMPALNPMKLDRMSHRFSLKHWANKNRVAIICALLAGLGLAALFMFGTQKTSGGVSRKIQNRMSLT